MTSKTHIVPDLDRPQKSGQVAQPISPEPANDRRLGCQPDPWRPSKEKRINLFDRHIIASILLPIPLLALEPQPNPPPEPISLHMAEPGVFVHAGTVRGETAILQARAQKRSSIHGLARTKEDVETSRAAIAKAGFQERVSVHLWNDPTKLPFPDNSVNLLYF